MSPRIMRNKPRRTEDQPDEKTTRRPRLRHRLVFHQRRRQYQHGQGPGRKYSCATCHGKDYSSPIDPSYPKLAGQHKDYLEHALIAYKRGDKANGRNNAIMTGQVKPLSNQDIKDLAAYLHSLPSSLVTHR
ncbi:Cytochrome c4 precursor [Janthinobacterium lividum]|nr:Cytochrome c4 precursor [Janthinobacterium lividum]